MKNIWTKLLAMTLCVLMIAAPLTGMAEEVSVSALIQAGSGILPPEDNFVIKALEEKLGFDLNIIVTSNSDDLANRKATMAAARSMTDIIHASRSELDEMVANGVVLPLNDLLEQYAPNLLLTRKATLAAIPMTARSTASPPAARKACSPPCWPFARTGWTIWAWRFPPTSTSSTRL